MNFVDEQGRLIYHIYTEREEQLQAEQYIPSNAVVLELGARYGTVSCMINSKLSDKNNQVSVEPDERVWAALEENMNRNDCNFNIVKGVISNKKFILEDKDAACGYGCRSTQTDGPSNIRSYRLDEIENMYNLKFDTLVADCEGFLGVFFEENPHMYDQLKLIIFEKDYPDRCDYEKIINSLKKYNFKLLTEEGFHEVWSK